MIKRKDGILTQDVAPLFKVIPLIMKERSDAQVFYSYEIPISTIEEYIDKKKEEGIRVSYLHVVYTAMIRTLAKRKKLNRFVMSGRTYQRSDIILTMMAKKSLSDDASQTGIKIKFNGNETVEEVRDTLNKQIDLFKEMDEKNNQDRFVETLMNTPFWLVKLAVNALIKLDKWNLLPQSIIDLSPFHSSGFITNMGSIGLDSIFHHIYNFGTVGIFVAMGKKKKAYVYEDEMLKEEKTISFSFVLDERICDGYYFGHSMRLFNKYLKNPELLDIKEDLTENLDDILEQVAPED